MSDDIGSLTCWIHQLDDKNASPRPMQAIWEHEYQKVKRYLLVRFRGFDEDDAADAANSAFENLFAEIEKKHYDLLMKFPDREDFVGLLFQKAFQRACNQIRAKHAKKREGGHKVFREADQPEPSEEHAGLDWIADSSPLPQLAVQWADECAYLLGKCDEQQRRVLLGMVEGKTQPEIALELDCSLATVERTLARIRKKFQREGLS